MRFHPQNKEDDPRSPLENKERTLRILPADVGPSLNHRKSPPQQNKIALPLSSYHEFGGK